MVSSEFRELGNYVFGSTAAIVTNISLIVGLGSAGAGKKAILGGLLTIAIADNISDSLGIHMYEETEGRGARLSLLTTTLNFSARLLVSLSFIALVMMLSISQAGVAAIIWGLSLLILLSYLINRSRNQHSVLEIVKHLLIAVIAILLSRCAGKMIAQHFQ